MGVVLPRVTFSGNEEVELGAMGSQRFVCVCIILLPAPPVQSPLSGQPQLQAPPSLMGLGGGFHGDGEHGWHYLLDSEPKKKKYAKEAWPGKKPAAHLLI